jgi:formylglycine-generating enzyme required for sulfatase activity
VVESVGELSAQLRAEKEADIQRQAAETEKHERAVADQARLRRAAAEEQQRQLEARRAQDADWQVACAQNTPAGYEAFLKKWPNSAYATDARRFIRLLRKAEKLPIQWTRYAGIGGTALAASSVLFVWWLNPSGCTTGSNTGDPNAIVSGMTKQDTQNTPKPPGFQFDYPMVSVEGGTFMMGSNTGESDEKPVHQVTLTDFAIGKCEVTQAQWQAVMGENPSRFKGCDNCPVESVSWDDVQAFLQRLNEKTGKRYRLPTEAEWEYAARGGEKGANDNFTYAGGNDLDEVGWFTENTKDKGTWPVGGKKANQIGLYDMSGNVWEWCADWYGDYPKGPVKDPKGPGKGSYRVLRGGSWDYYAGSCRVSGRSNGDPGGRGGYGGFRVAASSQ